MATEVLKDVTPEMVEEVKQAFEQDGCTVEVILQENGLYTIKANCPE